MEAAIYDGNNRSRLRDAVLPSHGYPVLQLSVVCPLLRLAWLAVTTHLALPPLPAAVASANTADSRQPSSEVSGATNISPLGHGEGNC